MGNNSFMEHLIKSEAANKKIKDGILDFLTSE